MTPQRPMSQAVRALLAAGLVTTSGSILWVTIPANADGPSLALSVLALGLPHRPLERAVDSVLIVELCHRSPLPQSS